MIAQLKVLEDDRRRLKKMYAEEPLKAEAWRAGIEKVVKPSQRRLPDALHCIVPDYLFNATLLLFFTQF